MSFRGFGAVDISHLAQAQFLGQLAPSFLPQQYFDAGYSTEPQAIPTWEYATNSFAEQLAGLLGGSVVQAPPPGNLQGKSIPPANWIQTPDGTMVLPGDLVQPGTVLAFQDECAAERYFVDSIPGAMLSAACASGQTGLVPSQISNPPAASIIVPPSLPVTPVTLPPSSSISGGGAPAPTVLPSVPASNVAPLIATGTPGANVSAATGAPASSDVVVGGFDLSQVPWYWWVGGAAVLAFAFGGKH